MPKLMAKLEASRRSINNKVGIQKYALKHFNCTQSTDNKAEDCWNWGLLKLSNKLKLVLEHLD